MKTYKVLLASIFLVAPMSLVMASDLDDVTMDVLHDNDPSEITHDISLPGKDDDVDHDKNDDLDDDKNDDMDDDKNDDAEEAAEHAAEAAEEAAEHAAEAAEEAAEHAAEAAAEASSQ